MSGGFTPLLALMNGGSTGGAKEVSNVKGADTTEMRSAFNHNMISDQMFWADYPAPTDISLHKAKEFDAPNIKNMMDIWTLFDDTTPFSSLMPVVATDNMKIMIHRKVYLPSLAKRNPERTRAHTVEHRNKSFQGIMERMSIMIEIGYPALGTPLGQEIYSNGLVQMRNATLEANVVNMLNTLQTSPGIYRNPGTRYKHVDNGGGPRSLADALSVEKQFFMIFQRPETSGKAFQLLNALIDRIQGPERGKGDVYVMPKKILTYNTLIPDTNTLFLFGGEKALQKFQSYNPEAPLGSDGLGHAIVTFKSFNVEDEPAFDPFTRYIGISEVCEFGKETSKLLPSEFSSESEKNDIYDVDNDDWATITPEYVLDNCGRFDLKSGQLLSMRSRDINRRSGAAYAEEQKTDTYHYTVDAGGKLYQMPIVEIGLFDPENFTHEQRRDIAAVAVARMTSLRDGANNAIDATTAIREGRELIQAIEETPLNADFLNAAAAGKGGALGGSATSSFATAFRTGFFEQNEFSGWGLPRVAGGNATTWPSRGVPAPIGYGSAAGILSINKDWVSVGSNAAAFEAAFGFPGEIGRKAHNFAVVLNEYAKYAKKFFSTSRAVDPSMCSPWWLKGDERHVLFDNIIATQYRQPFLRPTGGAAAPAQAPAANAREIAQLEAYFVGNYTGVLGTVADITAANGNQGPVSAAALPRPQAPPNILPIMASIDAAAPGDSLAVNPDQGGGPITGINTPQGRQAMADALPAIASAAIGAGAATVVALGAAGAAAYRLRAAAGDVPQAFLAVAAAVYLTKGAPLPARYALLYTLAGARNVEADPAGSAQRLLAIYNAVIAPSGLPLQTLIDADSSDAAVLNSLDLVAVVGRFDAYVRVQAGGGAVVASTAQAAGNQVVMLTRNVLGGGGAAAAGGGALAVTPLVYSPQQLAAADEALASRFSSIHDPSQPMSAADFAAAKDSISTRDPNVRPVLYVNSDANASYGSVATMAMVNHLIRANPVAAGNLGGGAAPVGGLDVDMTDVLGARAAQEAVERSSGLSRVGMKRRGDQREIRSVFSDGAGLAVSRNARDNLMKEAAAKRARAPSNQNHGALLSRLSHPVFIQNWDAAASEESPLINWTRRVLELTEYNLHQLKDWGRPDIQIPRKVHALLFRTWTLGTQTIIKVLKGGIGNQHYGNAMYTWALDGQSRMFSGLWSYYYLCLPENWENIFHADNVFCSEYLGGGGVLPVGNDDTAQTYEAHGLNEGGKSVHVCLEPPAPVSYPPEISWTGRKADVVSRWGVILPPARRLDFKNAYVFNLMYGIAEMQSHIKSSGAAENLGFEPADAPYLAFMGPVRTYDAISRKRTNVSTPHGYLPLSMYATGLKSVLKGELLKAPVPNAIAIANS